MEQKHNDDVNFYLSKIMKWKYTPLLGNKNL